jgi:hypothetical protein
MPNALGAPTIQAMNKSSITPRRWQLAAQPAGPPPAAPVRVRRYRLVPLAARPAISPR